MRVVAATGCRRRWYLGVGGLVVATSIALNLPGQLRYSGEAYNDDARTAPHFEDWIFSHGWPIPYLIRRGHSLEECGIVDLFSLGTGVVYFSSMLLLVNFICAFGLALVLSCLVRHAFSTGKPRVSLRFALATVFLVAAAFGWIRWEYTAAQREHDLLRQMDSVAKSSLFYRVSRFPIPSKAASREPWGPTCLRLLSGNTSLSGFDRVVSLYAAGGSAKLLGEFSNLRRLTIRDDIDSEAFETLSNLRCLVSLDISACSTTSGDFVAIYNPKLQRLDAEGGELDGNCLRSLTSLRWLSIASSTVTKDQVASLSILPELRVLKVSDNQFDPSMQDAFKQTVVLIRPSH